MNLIIAYISQPFPLLDKNPARWFFALFCGGFATLFLYVFNPYDIQSWQYDSELGQTIPIWLSGLLAIPVLIFTQIILRPWILKGKFSVWHAIVWLIIELFLLTLLFFPIFGNQVPAGWPAIAEFIVVGKHTILIAFLPYLVALLFLSSRKNISPDIPDSDVRESNQTTFVSLLDENDKVALTIRKDHIMYLKSEDNYILLYYLNDHGPGRTLIRTNLKKLEAELDDADFMRIHRSYMVHLSKISKVEKSRKGYLLHLDSLPEKISVSAGFKVAFEEKMIRPS